VLSELTSRRAIEQALNANLQGVVALTHNRTSGNGSCGLTNPLKEVSPRIRGPDGHLIHAGDAKINHSA